MTPALRRFYEAIVDVPEPHQTKILAAFTALAENLPKGIAERDRQREVRRADRHARCDSNA